MRKCLEIILILSVLLFAITAYCWAEQFKITKVYDALTVRAEGYDTDCLP